MIKREIEVPENMDISELFGRFDGNMKLVEKAFGVSAAVRDNSVRITGDEDGVDRAGDVIHMLITMLCDGESLDEQKILYAISLEQENGGIDAAAMGADCVAINVKGQPIKTKTLGQKKYVEAIEKNTIVFGIGPAGTGKTYLAARGEPHNPYKTRRGGGGKARLSAGRPAEQGRSVPETALRRHV